MANQPEAGTYDVGVYQLEITDPVQGGIGGVDNAPLLNLANRTGWLKNQITSILASIAALAGLNSPAFTGTPTAPTPAAGDNSTAVATTAFADNLYFGIANCNIAGAGNIVLTSAQYGCGVLNLQGALTGARIVVLPNTGRWLVVNLTTGAYSVTLKTAGGAGITIVQGTTKEVYGDGINIGSARSEFDSIAMTGAPTAPTPAAGDSSTKVATTAFAAAVAAASFSSGSGWEKNNITGTIIQRGTGVLPNSGVATSNANITFPVNFPTGVTSIKLTPANSFTPAGGNAIMQGLNATRSGFTAQADTNLGGTSAPNNVFAQTVSFWWEAVGY